MSIKPADEVVSATDEEILDLLRKYSEDVLVYLKEQFSEDDLEKLSMDLPGISYVASRKLINITREDRILGKLYAFTEWGCPKRLFGSNPDKWNRLHCVALFAHIDRSFYVDMCAGTIRDLFGDDPIHSDYPPLDTIQDVYVGIEKPWYFESDHDRIVAATRPTEKVKVNILKEAYEVGKDPERRSIVKMFLEFINKFKPKG